MSDTAEKKYPLATVGPKIDSFLQLIAGRAGFEWNYKIAEGDNLHPDFENPEILVRFTGSDVDLLLENKAELMLAIEQLTMEMLRMPPEDHSRLCFDANDYRMLRIEELRLSAVTAAEKVKKSRVPFRFSPMNSRERRILHLALRNDSDVRSESSGMGPQRSVVIYPSDMATPPESPRPFNRPPQRGKARRRSA
ncbi:MAG: protein jag [Bryobacteraceae bacterium]